MHCPEKSGGKSGIEIEFVMDILIKILQFVLSFSLLVIVHELGHFMFARIFGVRVEQFQLFFGKPVFSFVRRGTRYGVGWIPFGGYVKLAGMIDESMDTEQMKSEPRPDEFRSKPAWQRLIIMVGGVFMNVVLAFLIYVGISYHWGDAYLSTEDMKYGYVFSPQAEDMGFRDGDRILSVNGRQYEDFRQLRIAMLLEQNYEVAVLRGGDTVTFTAPDASVLELAEDAEFMSPRYPFIVGMVLEDGGAARAGIEAGDRFVELQGEPLEFFDEYVERLPDLSGQTVDIAVRRDSAGVDTVRHFAVGVSVDGKIGAVADMMAVTPVHTRKYTFWQSFPAGWKRIGEEIGSYWKQLKLVFTPKTEAYKSLGGPISIGNIFPEKWNWYSFWEITALLSVILAVMNILPIPALDGGHVLFLLVEVVTGRKPGDKFLMYAQVVGMTLLFALMIYATWNDIARLLTGF